MESASVHHRGRNREPLDRRELYQPGQRQPAGRQKAGFHGLDRWRPGQYYLFTLYSPLSEIDHAADPAGAGA
jgi:hypothetical protein